MKLLVKDLRVQLPNFDLAVAELDLESRFTVLFGPSGSGKTTLLEAIAGLRRVSSGVIRQGDRVLTDTARNVFVPPRLRRIGYVPQDLGLFPHLSVRDNLLYGSASGAKPLFSLAHVAEALELQSLLGRRSPDLSGGESRRVALARALLSSPEILLLDEPLANLDLPLKRRILPGLARIRDEFKIPMVYVTHDRSEALSLAEKIVVMAAGRVLQSGTVADVFRKPADLAVAGIVSVETIQPGRVIERNEMLVVVQAGSARITALAPDLPAGTVLAQVCIRAEDVVLLKEDAPVSSPRNRWTALVRGVSAEGPLMRVDLDCGFPLAALLTRQACEELQIQPGRKVIALVKAPQVHLIPAV
jgi:molybdate transport system ATP-binding protein